MEAIREGLEDDLDVSIYAKKIFLIGKENERN